MKSSSSLTRTWKTIFIALLVAGSYATVIRFVKGLGASTNLSDEFPWGFWIGFDILVGVGLAAGGFVIAASVHIFQLKKYSPIARPAILTAFLGYLLVIVALMFDLGRPYRIWHPIVMGNPHSVMFEVAICVMLYTTVLALEFSPLILIKFNLKAPLRIIRLIYLPLVILGVLLSTLHQSSLGTLYIIVPDKLHGLWYSPLMPVFFFLSAIAVGLAMTIFESFMSFRAFGKRLEHDLLEGISRALVVVLALLLVLRVQNLADRGNLHLAFEMSQESVMFWGEILLGVALPLVLFMIPRVRASHNGLFFGAMLTIMGFILNRLNVAVTGLVGAAEVNYIPSWMEFAITASIVALGMYLFRFAVAHLEIFPDDEVALDSRASNAVVYGKSVIGGRVLLGLWGLTIAGFLILGFSNLRDKAMAADGIDSKYSPVSLGTPDLQLPGNVEIRMSKDSPGQVVFDHYTHFDLNESRCADCHAGRFRITPINGTSPAGVVTNYHDAEHCGRCHNGNDAFDAEEDCESCHAE